jgi:hypothetical protein
MAGVVSGGLSAAELANAYVKLYQECEAKKSAYLKGHEKGK